MRIFSQELPVHEQYIFDYSLLNPAFTGISEAFTFRTIHRQQWMGVEHPPHTSFLSIKGRIKGSNTGLGGYVYNDVNGAFSKQGCRLTYAYHLLLKNVRRDKLILSLAVSAECFRSTIDQRGFDRDIYDPIVSYSLREYISGDANVGVLLSYNLSFIGLSIENFITRHNRNVHTFREPSNRLLYNIHTGYSFMPSRKTTLRPSVVFKSNFHGLSQLDVNIKFTYADEKGMRHRNALRAKNMFFAGLSYRNSLDRYNKHPLSLAPFAGLVVGCFEIMYLYDINLTAIYNGNYGTHQISIGIKLFPDKFLNWGKHGYSVVTDEF